MTTFKSSEPLAINVPATAKRLIVIHTHKVSTNESDMKATSNSIFYPYFIAHYFHGNVQRNKKSVRKSSRSFVLKMRTGWEIGFDSDA